MPIIRTIDRVPQYYEKIELNTSGVSQPNQTYREDSNAIFMTVEDNNIRYRIDGSDPGSVTGHLVYATGNLYLVNPLSLRNLKMIAITNPATVQLTYYK